jgi:hypothetical protein
MKSPLLLLLLLAPLAKADDTAWPPVTREAKPWTRWWWLGSGVDAENLTKQLEEFSKAGLGGVEICPIYGAKGYEKRDLPFLSEEWTKAYAHTAREAARLDMGGDLTTGTGWPFGGPRVQEEDASASLASVKLSVEGGKEVTLPLPEGRVEVLKAWPEAGEPVDLTGKIEEGRLIWTAPAGKWSVHGLVSKHGIQKVKRSAPGGARICMASTAPSIGRRCRSRGRTSTIPSSIMARLGPMTSSRGFKNCGVTILGRSCRPSTARVIPIPWRGCAPITARR